MRGKSKLDKMDRYIPLTKKDFLYFRAKCREYQKLFSLMNWELWFEHVDLSKEDVMGRCTYDIQNHQATISLSKILPSIKDTDRTKKQILARVARHEIFHLIVGVLDQVTERRYVTDLEVQTAIEGLVRHIEQIYKAAGGT